MVRFLLIIVFFCEYILYNFAYDVNLELGVSPINVNMKALKKMRALSTPPAYCVAEEQLPAPKAISLLYQPLLYFWKTTITVKSNFPLQWHAVRGLSDDDFYSNIRVTALKYLFRLDDEDTRRIIQKREDREGFGLMRDILSSCPSPFTGNPMEPTTCVMHFSSIGKPCLYLNMDGDSLLESMKGTKRPRITVQAESTFNSNGLIRLVAGLLLLQLCNELSKSKIVQYLSGIFSFIFLGLLIMALKLASRLMHFKKDNRKWQWALFFIGTYLASAIYFVKVYIREALIEYWEFTVGYLFIMSVLGASFTYYMRSCDDRKHVYRVAGKHLVRIIAMVLIYNGSASPLASILTMFFSIIGYVRYSLLKRRPRRREKGAAPDRS